MSILLILVSSFWVIFCWPKEFQQTQKRLKKYKHGLYQKNIKEVQSFLGLASYYRQFIDKFAQEGTMPSWACWSNTTPSNKHKKARARKEATTVNQFEPRIFEWTMKHQEAFDALKEALSTAPVLAILISPGNSYWR